MVRNAVAVRVRLSLIAFLLLNILCNALCIASTVCAYCNKCSCGKVSASGFFWLMAFSLESVFNDDMLCSRECQMVFLKYVFLFCVSGWGSAADQARGLSAQLLPDPGFLPGAARGKYPKARQSHPSKGVPPLYFVTLHLDISPRVERSLREMRTSASGRPRASAISESSN